MNLVPLQAPVDRQGRFSSRRHIAAAFTLMEVLIVLGLSSLVLTTVASLTLYGARSSIALVNYTDLDAKSRYALDVITREIRQANAVTSLQTNNNSITLTNSIQAALVTLKYDPSARTVTLSKTGQADAIVLTECDRWSIGMYQRTPIVTATNLLFYPATNTAGVLDRNLCKLLSLSWKCSRQILAQKVNTESVQAAQVVLRSKQ